ncbi:hypothetical protein [Massilia sp. Dwa41.01b]|uniref:hypothetical protein n=1 Tax=Massilia sp. Dwa41.01b TaxID=2709302 RepID=UPI002803EFEC|nr:hypothetical protein [Massilia sp. Dwa41.01b]
MPNICPIWVEAPNMFSTPISSMTRKGTLLNTAVASKAKMCQHWLQRVARVKRGSMRGSATGCVTGAAAAASLALPNRRLPVPARCGLNRTRVRPNKPSATAAHTARLARI